MTDGRCRFLPGNPGEAFAPPMIVIRHWVPRDREPTQPTVPARVRFAIDHPRRVGGVRPA